MTIEKDLIIEMNPVVSSNITHVGYRQTDQTLRIKFGSGGVYDYTEVPVELVKELIENKSIGSFFHKNIRKQWVGRKLTEEEQQDCVWIEGGE